MATVTFFSTPLATASPSAKLVFARGTGADACPSEPEFRAAVTARVGYDPFFPFAKRTVVTRIDRVAQGQYRARMEILDDRGGLLGEKAFVSKGHDCEELVRTLALAVSLAIDVADEPASPDEPASEPASPAPPAQSPEPLALPPPPPSSPSDVLSDRASGENSSRLAFELSVTTRASLGLAPSANPGVAMGAALGRRSWSLGVEGRYDFPSSADVDGNVRVAMDVLAGSVVPCVHWRALLACLPATVGRVRAESFGIRHPATDEALFLSVGARLGVEVEATQLLAFRAALDVGALPLSHSVAIGMRSGLYETSSIYGSLGATAVARF